MLGQNQELMGIADFQTKVNKYAGSEDNDTRMNILKQIPAVLTSIFQIDKPDLQNKYLAIVTAEKPFKRICRDITELKSYDQYGTHSTIFALIRNTMVHTYHLGKSTRALVDMLIKEDVLSKCTAVLSKYDVCEVVLRSTSFISTEIITWSDHHNSQTMLGIAAAMKIVIAQTRKKHTKNFDLLQDICSTLSYSCVDIKGKTFLNFVTSLVSDGSVLTTSVMVGLHHQDPSSNNRLVEKWVNFVADARFPGNVKTIGMKEIRPIICSMSNYLRDYTKTEAITDDSVIYKLAYLLEHIAASGEEKDIKILLKHQFIKKLARLVLDDTDMFENINVTARFIQLCYLLCPSMLSKEERGIRMKINIKEFKPILDNLPVLMSNDQQNVGAIYVRTVSLRIIHDVVMSGKTSEDLLQNFLPSGSLIIKAMMKLWLYKYNSKSERKNESGNRVMILTTWEHLINPSNFTTSDFIFKVLKLLKPTFRMISHYLSSSTSSKIIADNKEEPDFRVVFRIFRYLKTIAAQICELQKENNIDEIAETIIECELVYAISKVASDYRFGLYDEILSDLIHTINGLCAIIPKEKVVKPFIKHLTGLMALLERNYDNESISSSTSTFFLIVTAYSFGDLMDEYGDDHDLDRIIPIPEITGFWIQHVIDPSSITTQSTDQLEITAYFLRATWMLEPLANRRKCIPLTTAITSDYKGAVLGAVAYYFNNSESYPLTMLRKLAEFVGFISPHPCLSLKKNYDIFISSCRNVTQEFSDKIIVSNIEECLYNVNLVVSSIGQWVNKP